MWAQSRHVSAPGSYGSVTELNGPPLIRWLKKNYGDSEKIEIDFSSMVWILDGVFAHELFSKQGAEALPDGFTFIEETLSFDVPVDSVGIRSRFIDECSDRYVISFTPDLVTNGKKISDYKKTSVYNIEKIVKTGEVKIDWEHQLNVYAEGLLRNSEKLGGFDPSEMEIVAWMRDWGPRHLRTSTSPFKKIAVPLWDRATRCQHIVDRIKLHATADNITVDQGIPPACTREERWHKTYDEKSFVPGPRCKSYCNYNTVCPYMVSYVSQEDTKDEGEE